MNLPTNSVDDIIVSPVEPGRARDPRAERLAFLALSDVLAREPANAVQRLVEAALELTHSTSAGVSVHDQQDGEDIFRWVAVAGELRPYLNAALPRHLSPCGVTVSRATTLVMRDPERFFGASPDLPIVIKSALLVPFAKQARVIGTLWVLSSSPEKAYSVDDVQIVERLLAFSSSLLDAWLRRRERYGTNP